MDVTVTPKFGVEHALDLYASSYVIFPAEAIYEEEKLQEYQSILDKCHIYVIGYLPKTDFKSAEKIGNNLKLNFSVGNKQQEIFFPEMPSDLKFKIEDGYHYLENDNGERFWWNDSELMKMIHFKSSGLNFEVKYIGQAYGKDGSRNALHRLMKHETLQKIAVKGVPDGYVLSLLLLEVEPGTTMVTAIRPNAQFKDKDEERIQAGLDKLYGTTEAERISLYEAALIRYFSPEFNKEFKNSFPSTNLKILHDCYEKDFSALFAQICIDELPCKLFSSAVEPKQTHISTYDLHQDDDRKAFFSL